jgi:hypothetical protein
MKLPLHLLALVVCACAGVAQAAPLDPANVAIRLTDLGPGVIPTAINNVGQVAGQGSNGQAFRWESGLLTSHGTLGGSQSYANNLNDSGVVVGWSLDGEGKQKSFKWENPATEMVNTTAQFRSRERRRRLIIAVRLSDGGPIELTIAPFDGRADFSTGRHCLAETIIRLWESTTLEKSLELPWTMVSRWRRFIGMGLTR